LLSSSCHKKEPHSSIFVVHPMSASICLGSVSVFLSIIASQCALPLAESGGGVDACTGEQEWHQVSLLQHGMQITPTIQPTFRDVLDVPSTLTQELNLTLLQNLVIVEDSRCAESTNFYENVKEMGVCISELLAVIDVSPHTPGASANVKQLRQACIDAVKDDLARARSLSVEQKLCGSQPNAPSPTARIVLVDYSSARVIATMGRAFETWLDCRYDEQNVDNSVSCDGKQGTMLEIIESMYKNTPAYLYGFAMVRTKYAIHLDSDILLTTYGSKWLDQALHVLGANDTIPGISFARCNDDPLEGIEVVATNRTYPHLTLEANLMDMDRITSLLPFTAVTSDRMMGMILDVNLHHAHAVPVFLSSDYGCRQHAYRAA